LLNDKDIRHLSDLAQLSPKERTMPRRTLLGFPNDFIDAGGPAK
jgi:hypothetical protein